MGISSAPCVFVLQGFCETFFSKLVFQPTCLHGFTFETRWLSRFVLVQAYTKPTRSLHEAYMILGFYSVVTRIN